MMLPLGRRMATVVGGIDCTESAAAAGDEYDTRAVWRWKGSRRSWRALAGAA